MKTCADCLASNDVDFWSNYDEATNDYANYEILTVVDLNGDGEYEIMVLTDTSNTGTKPESKRSTPESPSEHPCCVTPLGMKAWKQ